MKSKIIAILKILVIIVVILWMGVFVTDYFRAQKGEKPFMCLKESTKENAKGSYYECVSLGYKFFEYKEVSGQITYGFGAAFLENDIEKNWEK